jgi:hypothetical protein
VIYRERGDHPGRKVEEGVLTSFNEHHAFVRYSGVTPAATDFGDLEFAEWLPHPALAKEGAGKRGWERVPSAGGSSRFENENLDPLQCNQRERDHRP